MKDIDLLPEWYKSGRRRQAGLQGQYIALGVLLAVMVAWSFFAGSGLSRARARLAQQQPRIVQAEATLQQVQQLEFEIRQLKKQADLLEELDSGLNIPNVISELSYLIGSNLVLSEVSFEAEKLGDSRQDRRPVSGIRVARAGSAKSGGEPLGKVRFRVILKGIAAETSDVGEFVRKLEQSDYFCSVSLSFSRNKELKIGTRAAQQNKEVSEFEINCYLANYQLLEQGPIVP
jgi:Tfp pilus assembly protein PilN